MPDPDKVDPVPADLDDLTEEEILEDVVDLVGAGLKDLDTRSGVREAARAIPDAALEELVAALRQAPLFNGVSPEGIRALAEAARRIQIPPFTTLIDSENPDEGILKANGLLIALDRLIVDIPWLQNLAPGQHLGEGGWLGEPRMTTVNSQDEGAALVIDQALAELGLSAEDQLQIGFNALCNSHLAEDNAKLAANPSESLIHMESVEGFEAMASEAAERLHLSLHEAKAGEKIEARPGYVFLGMRGMVNIYTPDLPNLLGQIQFPNLCFEVSAAGGSASADIVTFTDVSGYWIPLAAEGKLSIENRLLLLQQVRRSHNLKLGAANRNVQSSLRPEESTPNEGALAGIINFFRRLRP